MSSVSRLAYDMLFINARASASHCASAKLPGAGGDSNKKSNKKKKRQVCSLRAAYASISLNKAK